MGKENIENIENIEQKRKNTSSILPGSILPGSILSGSILSGSMLDDDAEDHYFIPDLCSTQSVFFLILVSELMSVVLVLASGSLAWFDWQRLALVSLFVQWVALSSAMLLCWARPYLRLIPNHWAGILGYGIILIDVTVFSALSQWVMGNSELNPAPYDVFELVASFDWLDIGRNVIIAGITAGLVLRYSYLQEELNAKLRSELTHRLQALQSRIRPHFLFNSMNIIASLIETDPKTAESVVEDLSELFRASLDKIGNQVPFQQEVALCKRYMRIEKLRLGRRLEVEWDVDQVSEQINIPLLTIQPLLENAIYHGIQPLPEGGKIVVRAWQESGFLQFSVENPVPTTAAIKASIISHKGNKMALENTRHRLIALYGNKASLDIEEQDNQYKVKVRYPLSN